MIDSRAYDKKSLIGIKQIIKMSEDIEFVINKTLLIYHKDSEINYSFVYHSNKIFRCDIQFYVKNKLRSGEFTVYYYEEFYSNEMQSFIDRIEYRYHNKMVTRYGIIKYIDLIVKNIPLKINGSRNQDKADKVYDEGWAQGQPHNYVPNPYTPGTNKFKDWSDGYDDGYEDSEG